jgi:hypothetical protein
MASPIIEPGEKVLIIARRLFEGDLRRHFAGRVISLAGELVRVEGYAFVYNPWKNGYEKRSGVRTRIFSISDAGNIINVLPKEINLETLHYEFINDNMIVTDNAGFSMDVNEFSWSSGSD